MIILPPLLLHFCTNLGTGFLSTNAEKEQSVYRYTIKNDKGAEITFTNLGCTILSFKLQGQELTLNYGDASISAETYFKLNQVCNMICFQQDYCEFDFYFPICGQIFPEFFHAYVCIRHAMGVSLDVWLTEFVTENSHSMAKLIL